MIIELRLDQISDLINQDLSDYSLILCSTVPVGGKLDMSDISICTLLQGRHGFAAVRTVNKNAL